MCVFPEEEVHRFFRFSEKPMNRRKENPLLCTNSLSLPLPYLLLWKRLASPRRNMAREALLGRCPLLGTAAARIRVKDGEEASFHVFWAWPATCLDGHAASFTSVGAAPLPAFPSPHLVHG